MFLPTWLACWDLRWFWHDAELGTLRIPPRRPSRRLRPLLSATPCSASTSSRLTSRPRLLRQPQQLCLLSLIVLGGARATKSRTAQAPSRHSGAPIAARSNGDYVAVPKQAVHRKALINALSGCSSALKKQVSKRNILSRNKIPLSVSDIRKLVLVSAAGATCSGAASVGVVTKVLNLRL